MNIPLLKMSANRVRRNYSGGKILDTIQGKENPKDSNYPEDWICSLVNASNPGLAPIANEGLSMINSTVSLKDLISSNPMFYIGSNQSADSLGFLTKWIDSAMRLHIQAHPTKMFAQQHMGLPNGKFECYYILGSRESVKDPYIYLAFQRPPKDKQTWKQMIEEQDTDAILACFDKIPVEPGDVVYIPGGVPHAIGEGLLLLEVMEPSDLVVRCEFNREGIIVPPEARFMQRGIDFCLDIFDYQGYSVDQVKTNFFLKKKLIESSSSYRRFKLVEGSLSGCFSIDLVQVVSSTAIPMDGTFAVGVCFAGRAQVLGDGITISVGPLDSFFISAATQTVTIIPEGDEEVEIGIITPFDTQS